ncbi:hypothetical protein WMY93_016585 [Mugilogobius chulae]|uniref:Uncharacterized protein n=1 Tax=Mugilogobius chulae TaxID=88201 RepID=A0AAW0NNL0_9GOBI
MSAVCVTLLRASVRRVSAFTAANSRFCSSTTTTTPTTADKKKKKAKTSIERPAPSPTHDWIGPPNPLSNLRRRRSLDSEEMAVFYKSFLDRNRIRHRNYNKEWYRRNFTITFLMARVTLQNVWKNLSTNRSKKSSSSHLKTENN